MDLSVVVPIYNEEENIPILHARITEALVEAGLDYELILVDDGSTDNSYRALKGLAAQDPRVKVVRFRRNFGQTAAMTAGFDLASGRVVVPMDGDLQNDPLDIPLLLARIDEGYDVVSGWRKCRKDTFINRKLPSIIANGLISRMTGVHLHDYGCTLKAYRREVPRTSTCTARCTASSPHSPRRWGAGSPNCRSGTTKGCTARASTASPAP